MALFKRNKQTVAEEEKVVEKPAAAVHSRAALDSGRLAPVFWRMYRWIISANLAYDVYQIESGEAVFGDQDIPLRGRFSQLMQQLGQWVIPEYQEEFQAAFGGNHLTEVLRAGESGLSGIYCVAEGENGLPAWYELRAERIPAEGTAGLQCLIYCRPVTSKDSVRAASARKAEPKSDEERDWDAIRSEKLLAGHNGVLYEYNVEQDVLVMHRTVGTEQQTSRTEHYLATLDRESDWRIYHDDLKVVRRLFKEAAAGHRGEAVIRYREGGNYGAEFHHYNLVCLPLENSDKPTWLLGSLRDVEEEYRYKRDKQELREQLIGGIDEAFTECYILDVGKDTAWRLRYDEEGFHRDPKKISISQRIENRIQRGIIAEESAQNYRNWLQKGYLANKTTGGSWIMEGYLKLPGNADYVWYSDTLTPLRQKADTYLLIRKDVSEIHKYNAKNYEVQEKLRMADYNQSMLDIMSGLVEFRNVESGMHIYRVRALTRILLEDITRRSPQYELSSRQIELYCRAATMHDIGKITIPDSILNKNGRLTEAEYQYMTRHTTNGARIVEQLNMPREEELKVYCRDVALHHHERWDGKGYPDHLTGDEIAIGTQAIGLADAYDALVSKRCYKEAFSFEKAAEMILGGECGAFNPRLLETMKACLPKMEEQYANDEYKPGYELYEEDAVIISEE